MIVVTSSIFKEKDNPAVMVGLLFLLSMLVFNVNFKEVKPYIQKYLPPTIHTVYDFSDEKENSTETGKCYIQIDYYESSKDFEKDTKNGGRKQKSILSKLEGQASKIRKLIVDKEELKNKHDLPQECVEAVTFLAFWVLAAVGNRNKDNETAYLVSEAKRKLIDTIVLIRGNKGSQIEIEDLKINLENTATKKSVQFENYSLRLNTWAHLVQILLAISCLTLSDEDVCEITDPKTELARLRKLRRKYTSKEVDEKSLIKTKGYLMIADYLSDKANFKKERGAVISNDQLRLINAMYIIFELTVSNRVRENYISNERNEIKRNIEKYSI